MQTFPPVRLSLMLLGLVYMLPAVVMGQELIVDPDNPRYSPQSDSQPSSETSSEVIDDPENIDLSWDMHSDAQPQDSKTLLPHSSARFLGNYSTGLFVDTSFDGHDEDIVKSISELRLGIEYDLSVQTRAVINARFRYWVAGKENTASRNYLLNATDVRAHHEVFLDESYLLYRPGRWSFSVGNLIAQWGSTDIVRPGDVINPSDSRSLSASSGTGYGMQVPQFTVQSGYHGEGWSISALLVPFFVPNRVSLFGRDSSLANPRNPLIAQHMPIMLFMPRFIDASRSEDFQPVLAATRVPQATPRNASMGLRVTGTAYNTDLGVGYFLGWDRVPWMVMDEDLRAMMHIMIEDGQVLEDFDFLAFMQRHPQFIQASQRLSQKQAAGDEIYFSEYRRRSTLVLDVARYVGPVGVRADVAFSPRRVFYTTEMQAVQRASVFAALGLSYEILDEQRPLALSLEGFWLHPFARNSSLTKAFVSQGRLGDEDAELALIGDGYYGMASALLWGTPLWDISVQIGGMYTLSNRDWMVTTALSRSWNPRMSTTLGWVGFDGPDPTERLSLGGLYSHNEHIYLAIEGQF